MEVRLLLAGRLTDHAPVRYAGQRYYPRLLRAGVRIHEYQPRFLHLKMVMVDDWVSVGSCNSIIGIYASTSTPISRPSTRTSPMRRRQSLLADFADSREVILAMWRARPLWMRLHQRLWG